MATSSSRRGAAAVALTVVALALSTACATPPPMPSSGEATVQIQTFSGKTFVSVSVNDSALATLFLVDTGANRTVLSPTLARRLGLDVPGDAQRQDVTVAGGQKLSVPFVPVRRVAVGAARVPDLLVGVYDMFPNSPVIDGVLGTDFLGRFRVTFDPTQRTMHLGPGPVSVVPSSQGQPRGQEQAERTEPDTSATFVVALATPPVWKPGYEWSYS